MYDFVDRPVANLDHGSRFLVWSMRRWVSALGESKCPAAAVAPAFAQWKMIAGLQPFHWIMLMFNAKGLETFRFHALPCHRVSEHEAIILSLICSLRDSKPQAVRDTLAMLVEEESLGQVLESLNTLAGCMDEAAIFPSRKARGQTATR